jgi:hypothetical protein
MAPMKPDRPSAIAVVGGVMIIFGAAEVATGFTHHFFGLSTFRSAASTWLGASIGMLYVVAGMLLLTRSRRAAMFAIVALALDVAGRIAMVTYGLYPLTSSRQTFSFVTGTIIVAALAVYIALKSRSFE